MIKVKQEKVWQFTGFHSNVGKTFVGLASSTLKESRYSKRKTFAFRRKSAKTVKLFSYLTFVIYSIYAFYDQ